MSVNGNLPGARTKVTVTVSSLLQGLIIVGGSAVFGALLVGVAGAFAWWAFNGVCGWLGC